MIAIIDASRQGLILGSGLAVGVINTILKYNSILTSSVVKYGKN